MFVVIGALLLIIGGFIFFSLIGSQSNDDTSALKDLVAYQTEMGRIITLGVDVARDSSVKARATTARLSFLSDLNQVRTFMKSNDLSMSAEELAKYKTTSIDQQFDAAKQANNFDAVFTEVIDEKLDNYKNKLAEVFATQSNDSVKNGLRTFRDHADLLMSTYPPTPAP